VVRLKAYDQRNGTCIAIFGADIRSPRCMGAGWRRRCQGIARGASQQLLKSAIRFEDHGC
jgi:hypothetical protein